MNFKYPRIPLVMTLVIILSTLLPTGCKQEPKTVEVVQNYGTGEISRRYNIINGEKEGIMKDFYPDGTLKAERLFENDIQVGKTTIYHKNGNIKEVQYYKEGKIHGGDTTFYEDGKPEKVFNFNLGAKDGYVRKWKNDGTLVYEAKYENEVLVEVKGEPIQLDTIKKN